MNHAISDFFSIKVSDTASMDEQHNHAFHYPFIYISIIGIMDSWFS